MSKEMHHFVITGKKIECNICFSFLSGFGDEYLRESEEDGDSNQDMSLVQGYKSVLGTKSNEESLVGTTTSSNFSSRRSHM